MHAQPTILVVEDKFNEREALMRLLRTAQYNVVGSERPEDAIAYLSQSVDLVVSDLRMGQVNGLELLRLWKERRPETPFIMLTAYGDIQSAVEAMKLGAADYLTKPVDPEQLLDLIATWLDADHRKQHATASDALHDTPFGLENSPSGIGIPPGTSLEDLERAAVEQALEEHHGNRTHAAKALGISVRTLQRKLKAWRGPGYSFQNNDVPSHEFAMSRT